MFRQAVSASSRALRAAPRAATTAAIRPFAQSQFQFAAPAFALRSAQPAASRWYSEAKEDAAKPAEEAKSENKEAGTEADTIAELKKALEAKDAEARDWKVRWPLI